MDHQQQLILAGGGHSHALVLLHWAMHPQRRPAGLITLINRDSTSLYSGMVPGLIAAEYLLDEISIDLRRLADRAGVALVIAEIEEIDLAQKKLLLRDRPGIRFDQLSLDVGAETTNSETTQATTSTTSMPIKPLEPALQWFNNQDDLNNPDNPIEVIGAGLSGIEIALALRRRWPDRPIQLRGHPGQASQWMQKALARERIDLLDQRLNQASNPSLPSLRCTGSQAPTWISASGLPCDCRKRVRTLDTLQVIGHEQIFATGDCAVIETAPRPASGVWAVRAAQPLAHNLEAACAGRSLSRWRPQSHALQLVGGRKQAWALWAGRVLGPHPWLWIWKRWLDQRFMARFAELEQMATSNHSAAMACRGCAAKLDATSLQAALRQAGLSQLAAEPEDAAQLSKRADTATAADQDAAEDQDNDANRLIRLQSIDGFPALISDPWLNGRLTALHACSDLWACGAEVDTVQSLITLPQLSAALKQDLLAQTLAGIQSALAPQGADLIGGHTLEDRHPVNQQPASLGLQVALTVNGTVRAGLQTLAKGGLRPGDELLLSRPLGTGVLFAAAMLAAAKPGDLDAALAQMNTSQHQLVSQLQRFPIHACTDITGFGLLGHLGEMLTSSNRIRASQQKPRLQVELEAGDIPALGGAICLFQSGHASSLAPANRQAWSLLDATDSSCAAVHLSMKTIKQGSAQHLAVLELLVDPQTCGPLLVSCDSASAADLIQLGPWQQIGHVSTA